MTAVELEVAIARFLVREAKKDLRWALSRERLSYQWRTGGWPAWSDLEALAGGNLSEAQDRLKLALRAEIKERRARQVFGVAAVATDMRPPIGYKAWKWIPGWSAGKQCDGEVNGVRCGLVEGHPSPRCWPG